MDWSPFCTASEANAAFAYMVLSGVTHWYESDASATASAISKRLGTPVMRAIAAIAIGPLPGAINWFGPAPSIASRSRPK